METFHRIVNDTNLKFAKKAKEYKCERIIWVLDYIIDFNLTYNYRSTLFF